MQQSRQHIVLFVVLILTTVQLSAREDRDSAIYQGINLKLDIFNSILEPARTKGQLQTYEIAINTQLKNRFYPTLEAGYAFGQTGTNENVYHGQGGYFRIGLDLNGLKKHPESPNALLVGIRLGEAFQTYDQTGVYMNDTYWQKVLTQDFHKIFRYDAWGEVVAGCQVRIASGFTMGWYARIKVLFTKTDKKNIIVPYYIPGFGYRRDLQWGLDYYLGWNF